MTVTRKAACVIKQNDNAVSEVAVIGGGAWGTALAVHAGRLGHNVRLWVRETEVVERIRTDRANPEFLPGVEIPPSVTATNQLAVALRDADLILSVVPSGFARAVFRSAASEFVRGVPVVAATKGIEEDSLALPLDVIREELGDDHALAVLSGPSFAFELARQKPTAAVVASEHPGLAEACQQALSSSTLRLYSSGDPRGVQLAGALKNVMAIAAGVADSLEMGANAQAALITRGLAEMTRLGQAVGCEASTFSGLAGLGDLVLTCTGDLSRNRTLGQRIGRGEPLDAILGSTHSVAEGVRTTRSARELARRAGVEMPIVEELYRLLYEGASARDALGRLLSRPLTAEENAENSEDVKNTE
jgi:glycerol-3-phosphate dehydrogenase (NAD(P)+)